MSGPRSTPFRFYLYPALIVAAIGGLFSLFHLHPRAGVAPAEAPAKVQIGHDYYVTVELAELTELDPAGNSWDGINESGPDIFVEIYWKGNRIYQSTTKQDTFLAKWSNAELNLRDMAIKGGQTSMDDVIRAARLNIKASESIIIKVYDADLIGSALAGEKEIPATELAVGDTTYEFTEPGLKRLVVRVTDMNQAVDPLR